MYIRPSHLVLFATTLCFVVGFVHGDPVLTNHEISDDDEVWEAVSVDEGAFVNVAHSRSKRDAIKDLTKNSLTQQDRIDFLVGHNTARSIVSPTASNMKFMTWNNTLERLAQGWASKCKWEHGQVDEAKDLVTGAIGQNLWAGTGGYNVAGGVNSWDKEKADYTYDTKTCGKDKVCGHYTQVVWAKSIEVGCGIEYCKDFKGFKTGWYIVCNYLKAGNFKGQFPYEKGTSCSNCGEGYSKCENKLCRPDSLCGELKCAGGETMDTTTCLCGCGADPDNKKGAFCGDHPGAASGMYPSVLLLVVTATARAFLLLLN